MATMVHAADLPQEEQDFELVRREQSRRKLLKRQPTGALQNLSHHVRRVSQGDAAPPRPRYALMRSMTSASGVFRGRQFNGAAGVISGADPLTKTAPLPSAERAVGSSPLPKVVSVRIRATPANAFVNHGKLVRLDIVSIAQPHDPAKRAVGFAISAALRGMKIEQKKAVAVDKAAYVARTDTGSPRLLEVDALSSSERAAEELRRQNSKRKLLTRQPTGSIQLPSESKPLSIEEKDAVIAQLQSELAATENEVVRLKQALGTSQRRITRFGCFGFRRSARV